MQIPGAITKFIRPEILEHLADDVLSQPIGEMAIMHTHNTLPSMAQRYHLPMWKVPSCNVLDESDVSTISGNRSIYEGTREKYKDFAMDLLTRMSALD